MDKLIESIEQTEYPDTYSTIFWIIINLTGLLLSSTILIATFSKPNSESARIILSLLFADVLFSSINASTMMASLPTRHYGLGVNGCLVYTFLATFAAGLSLGSVNTIAMERYVSVCKQITVTKAQSLSWIGANCLLTTIATMIPFLGESVYDGVQLDPTGWACTTRWYGRTWANLTHTIFATYIMTFSIFSTGYCYFNVYLKFSALRKADEKKQRKVLKRCILLTVSVFTLWTPYTLKIYYELITGRSVGSTWSHLASGLCSCCSAVNAIVLIKYDNRVKFYVLDLFGLNKEDITSSEPVLAVVPAKEVVPGEADTVALPNLTMTMK